ncbi:MAG TPA: hypothetical protein VIJ46_06785, partial [Rhabdochlamydiaceae bacterium]
MKYCLLIGIAAVSLSTALYSEETILETGVGVGVGIGVQAGDNDGYYESGDGDVFIWIGPGWYGG